MLLVIEMEVIEMDGDGDGGGDEGVVMKLVGGGICGVDVDKIRLCHCKGGCKMVVIGEMGATLGEGAEVAVGGVD